MHLVLEGSGSRRLAPRVARQQELYADEYLPPPPPLLQAWAIAMICEARALFRKCWEIRTRPMPRDYISFPGQEQKLVSLIACRSFQPPVVSMQLLAGRLLAERAFL